MRCMHVSCKLRVITWVLNASFEHSAWCMQFMEKEAITNAVVVGHSVSGVWLQLLSVQVSHSLLDCSSSVFWGGRDYVCLSSL